MTNETTTRNEYMRIASTIIALIVLFGLAVLLIAPVHAAGAPTVTVSNYTVSPAVIMPGTLGTITVTIKNTAATASVVEKSGKLDVNDYSVVKTSDINVNIEKIHLEGNGITVLSKDFSYIGELGPGQSLPVTFSIEAPDRDGIYYPEVWIDTSGARSVKYPVPVNVNTAIGIRKDAILILNTSLTGSVNPGEEIPVTLTVENAGSLLADDVTLTVANVSGIIAPKTADLYHVGRIGAGEQKSVDLVMLSDKNAGYGLVRVPVTIQYISIDGTPVTKTTGIDVVMKGSAELGFVSVDTSPARLTEGTPFDLTIRIENTGTGEAKKVSATVDMPAEGTKEAFIGKIKPGNDAPAIFLLEGMKGGSYPYNLVIRYTDDMGDHTLTRQMSLRVAPVDTTGNLIFMLIVIGILAFLAYRYWYLPKKSGNGSFPWERKS